MVNCNSEYRVGISGRVTADGVQERKCIMRGPGHEMHPARCQSGCGPPKGAGLSAVYLREGAVHEMDRDRSFSNR